MQLSDFEDTHGLNTKKTLHQKDSHLVSLRLLLNYLDELPGGIRSVFYRQKTFSMYLKHARHAMET
jgi:hypothetical protein